MSDLKNEVGKFNSELAKLQDLFQQALGMLKGEPEFAMAKEMTDGVAVKHTEWLKAVAPAIDWLEQEQKDLQQGLASTQARIVEVEKQLNDALAEAEKPLPAPPPPRPSLVPGDGDPRYGFALGAELMGLIGLGSAATPDQPKLGDVWQLESVDWKVDGPTPEQAPRAPQRPAEAPPSKPASDPDKSIGQSIDWTD